MFQEQLQCRMVRNVSPTTEYAVFEIIRIPPTLQHFFVIIAPQQKLIRMFDDVLYIGTATTQIRQYSHIDIPITHHKAARLFGIVIFWNTHDIQIPDSGSGIGWDYMDQLFGQTQSATFVTAGGDVYRNIIAFAKN